MRFTVKGSFVVVGLFLGVSFEGSGIIISLWGEWSSQEWWCCCWWCTGSIGLWMPGLLDKEIEKKLAICGSGSCYSRGWYPWVIARSAQCCWRGRGCCRREEGGRGGNGMAYLGTAERVGDYRGGNVSRPSPSPPPPPAPATAAGAGIGDLSRKLGSLEMGSNSQEPNQVLWSTSDLSYISPLAFTDDALEFMSSLQEAPAVSDLQLKFILSGIFLLRGVGAIRYTSLGFLFWK